MEILDFASHIENVRREEMDRDKRVSQPLTNISPENHIVMSSISQPEIPLLRGNVVSYRCLVVDWNAIISREGTYSYCQPVRITVWRAILCISFYVAISNKVSHHYVTHHYICGHWRTLTLHRWCLWTTTSSYHYERFISLF